MATRGKAAVPRKAATERKRPVRRETVVVSEQERRHLIDDIAYFHAERHRPVESDGCREQDRRQAEAEIEALLHRRRKR